MYVYPNQNQYIHTLYSERKCGIERDIREQINKYISISQSISTSTLDPEKCRIEKDISEQTDIYLDT